MHRGTGRGATWGIEDLLALRRPCGTRRSAARGTWRRISRASARTRLEEAYEVPTPSRGATWLTCATNSATCCSSGLPRAGSREEAGHFAFPDVVRAVMEKMVRRHRTSSRRTAASCPPARPGRPASRGGAVGGDHGRGAPVEAPGGGGAARRHPPRPPRPDPARRRSRPRPRPTASTGPIPIRWC